MNPTEGHTYFLIKKILPIRVGVVKMLQIFLRVLKLRLFMEGHDALRQSKNHCSLLYGDLIFTIPNNARAFREGKRSLIAFGRL